MVKIALRFKAELENIEELKPCGPEFSWYLKLTCTNCGAVSEKWNDVSLSEGVFEKKCKLCSRTSSVSVVKDSMEAYGIDDDDTFKTIVVFDCRGMEPCRFWARDGWIVKTVDGGSTFSVVNLEDGEWVEYCDKINQAVSIQAVEHKFVAVR